MTCPHCSAPLGVRLLPDFHSCIFCLQCDRPLKLPLLLRAGVPQSLLDRIDRWDHRSPKIMGVGISAELGEGLDDPEFVRAWKDVRDETLAILAELRVHLPARADLVQDVLDLHSASDWTDAAILGWRRQKIWNRWIHSYGVLIGMMEKSPRAPVPNAFSSNEERAAFETGVEWGAIVSTFPGKPAPVSIEELEILRARLGLQ